jgi:hypothetical protein
MIVDRVVGWFGDEGGWSGYCLIDKKLLYVVWNKDSRKFAVMFCWQQWVCYTIQSALSNLSSIANSECSCM